MNKHSWKHIQHGYNISIVWTERDDPNYNWKSINWIFRDLPHVFNHLQYIQAHSAQNLLKLHFICRKPSENGNLYWEHLVLVCLVLQFWFGFSFYWDFCPKSMSHHTTLWISVLIFETQGLLIELNCISHIKMWMSCIYERSLTLGNTHWLLKSEFPVLLHPFPFCLYPVSY